MPTLYDREKIHKLFLKYEGDLNSIMARKGTPKSKKTIKRYAIKCGWYDELARIRHKPDDLTRLEEVRASIYRILISDQLDNQKNSELKPKTYTEAVKCYLDVDLRIDEKLGRITDSESDHWKDILRDCVIPD